MSNEVVMRLLDLTQSNTVGHTMIDQDHEEFINLANRLHSASNSDFATLFTQLYLHTQQHFEREALLMNQYGFPALTEHTGEHQLLLGEFKHFKSRIDKGLIAFGRAFIEERLPLWFELHVSTMDKALVAHIRQHILTNAGLSE
jgi:hemerythrin-like metal-binding protein